jgi:hypothetical protein
MLDLLAFFLAAFSFGCDFVFFVDTVGVFVAFAFAIFIKYAPY